MCGHINISKFLCCRTLQGDTFIGVGLALIDLVPDPISRSVLQVGKDDRQLIAPAFGRELDELAPWLGPLP